MKNTRQQEMTKYGNYRSARESGKWVAAWKAANVLEDDLKAIAIADWWRNADLETVAPKLIWSYYNRTKCFVLQCIDKSDWNCTLGGIPFVSSKALDLQPLQKKWATVPAKEVLPIWEEWAAIHNPENVDVCRNLIELTDQGADHDLILEAKNSANIPIGVLTKGAKAAYNAMWNATSAYNADRRYAYNADRRYAYYAALYALSAKNAVLFALSAKNAALCGVILGQDVERQRVWTANWERYNDMFALYALEHLRGL